MKVQRTALAAAVLVAAMSAAGATSLDPALYQRIMKAADQAEQGDVAGAMAVLERLGRRLPGHSQARAAVTQQQVLILIGEESYQEAEALLGRALSDAPADFAPELRYLFAQVLVIRERFRAALDQLEMWLTHSPQPPGHGLFLAAYARYRLDDFAGSAAELERAIEQTPNAPGNWYELLAFAYVNDGRMERAIDTLEAQAEHFPDDARWWRHLAQLHFLAEQEAAGTASLATAGRVSRLNPDEIRRLAQLYAFLGAPERGARLLDESLASGTLQDDYEHRKLVAELWLLARETERADAALQVAAARTDSPEPLIRRAELLLQWEDYDAARGALRQALERTPEEGTHAKLAYLIGVAEFNLGNHTEARAMLGRVDAASAYAREAAELLRYLDSLAVAER